MKTPNILLAAAFTALLSTSLHATVTESDPVAGGIGYHWTVNLGASDRASFSRHVGAWSWEDNALFGNPGQGAEPVGWTHTSDWVALALSAPTIFTIRLERQAGVAWPSSSDPNRVASTASMFPSFTLWSGWDNDLAPQAFADLVNGGTPTDDWHVYNNHGAVAFAEDLTYRDHVDNSTATFVERSWVLDAGEYSIVLGSNAPATDPNRQGYLATFSTAAVPEPTSALMLLTGVCTLALSRRRA